jgi:Region found in RelA / SpoT proteins
MSSVSIDYEVLARKFGGLPAIDYDALAQKFGGQLLDDKPVLHASNDVEELRASAERQAPKIGDAIAEATESVPGAKLEAVRDSKDTDRIKDKAERQGVQPSQVADISAAKVTAPDQPAAERVLENIHGKLPVEKTEGAVTGEPGKNAVRQVQAIVDTAAPSHEPVKKAEVLIQTPEMAKAADETHDDYRKAQELRAAGKEAEAAQLESAIASTHESADKKAQRRIGNAQSSNTTQKEEGGTGDAGADGSSQSTKAAGEKESYASGIVKAPIPPSSIRDLQAKLSTSTVLAPKPPASQTVGDNLKNQRVEVRDAKGNWKSGKVLADNTTGGNNGTRRLRGVHDDGSKFDNVKIQDVRKEVPSGRTGAENEPTEIPGEAVARTGGKGAETGKEELREGANGAPGTTHQHPDVAVDFDGTLAKETGGEKLGEPLTERVNSIKKMLADGRSVVIFTRRVENDATGKEAKRIQDWLEKQGLPRLPVTAVKDASEFYDNNAHHAPTDANTPLIKSNNAKRKA